VIKMVLIHILKVLVVLLSVAYSCESAPLPAQDLRVEYVPLPVLGVAVRRPRFSWALGNHLERGVSQSSYHITLWNTGSGEKAWDSGIVISKETIGVSPSVDLKSDSSYQLRVVWYDHKHQKSPVSTGIFSTSFMEDSDWGDSKWISIPDPNDPRNQFRHSFHLPAKEVSRATCYISGLGYQRSWINGVRLGHQNNTLGAFSQFQRRVAYNTYDVSQILKPGKNVLSVLLGRGWYSLREDNFTKSLGTRRLAHER